MAETSLTIQEASELSGKSIQTLRRAIKSNRITCKRKKTAQGFIYMISRESIVSFYKLKMDPMDREHGGVKQPAKQTEIFGEFATLADLKKLQQEIELALEDHKKEKENFMRFMKAFQEKFVFIENQLKLLEQPKKKSWLAFWKK